MRPIAIGWSVAAALAASCFGFAQQKGPEVEAHLPAQAAADVLRDVAKADGAFLAAGMLSTSGYQADNLATLLQYPTDTVVVLGLTGAQVRQAFERSVSLYPQPNFSFLQVSGFEISFDAGAAPNQRVRSVSAPGGRLEDSKVYNIAMPVSLARGAYGYFKIWNESKIVSTVPDMTVEKALAGKKYVETRPRWAAQS